jgi:transcriptional regulator with XRE-family HTH domain
MPEMIKLVKSLLAAHKWTQTDLAEHLGVEQATVSRWINKGVEPRGETRDLIRAMAAAAGLLEDRPRTVLSVMGYVGAGGAIEPDEAPKSGVGQIELPASAIVAGSAMVSDPVAFLMRGTWLYPAFSDGELLIVERRQPWSVDQMIGLKAVTEVREKGGRGRLFVKRIMRGSGPQLFNLESLDPHVPTMTDVHVVSARPVQVTLANIGLKWRSGSSPEKPNRK